MPFTPYHFGPAAVVSLPLKKKIDIPVFILVNVVIDIEPLIVLIFKPEYPVHGYAHTLLFSLIIGTVFGFVAYIFRDRLGSSF